MSSYLLTFLVSRFTSKGVNISENKRLTVWAPARQLRYTEPFLQFGTNHIKYFEEYFNIPDPLPKQDFVVIRNLMVGGMENWGMILFR